jgi:hypothetical protein
MPNTVHRLWSYDIAGFFADENAQEIYSKSVTFPWTQGVFPVKFWYPPDLDKRSGVNKEHVATGLDEYKKVFGNRTTFELCNNDREYGCQIMRKFFKVINGLTQFRYWSGYNTTMEEGLVSLITDKNNREVYLKMDGDDEGDQTRYGLVGLWKVISSVKDTSDIARKIREFNRKRNEMDWKDY